MKKFLLFLIVLSFILTHQTYAQDASNPDGIAIRYIGTNYQWPLEDISALKRDDFTSGLEMEYYRYLSERFNLSFPLRIASAELPANSMGVPTSSTVNMGLDAMLNFKLLTGGAFRPHLFAGVGGLLEDMENLKLNIPVGLGLNFLIGKGTYLTTTAGYHFNTDDFRDHLQAGIGLRIIVGTGEPAPPEVSDRDMDGLPDAEDLCPDEFGTLELYGCPDRDGDGVVDSSDACPDIAGSASLYGCPDTDGDGIADKSDKCPNEAGPTENEGCPVSDRDGDGVSDAQDHCPDTPGLTSLNGCPDRDMDGIADNEDDCPNMPGLAVNRGCPDTDNDGVVDRLDACPEIPGPAATKGCPEIAQTDREVLIEAVQAVEFETASATIRSGSYDILDKVADILHRYSGYKVRIGGHTDSIGSAATNQSLSEKRAKSCYDYLVSKGIAPARMSYQGYGETQPIGDNRFAPGREKNRRVEFDVYIE